MPMEDSALRIAGLEFLIKGDGTRTGHLDSPRYRDFRVMPAHPDITIHLRSEPVAVEDVLPAGSRRIFDSGTVWSLHESSCTFSIVLRYPSLDGTPYRIAIFDREFENGEIFTVAGPGQEVPGNSYDPLEFPLSEVLMVCMLSRRRGLMVHACGISHQGRGLLFPGNSTHGKSTMAGLWRDRARILNDDRIILVDDEGGPRMYGTPWHGDMSDVSSQGVALDSVYFLFHGKQNKVEEVSGARAVSMLLKRSFLPLWSREGMSFCLDFCRNMEVNVPFHNLHFIPDQRAVRLLT